MIRKIGFRSRGRPFSTAVAAHPASGSKTNIYIKVGAAGILVGVGAIYWVKSYFDYWHYKYPVEFDVPSANSVSDFEEISSFKNKVIPKMSQERREEENKYVILTGDQGVGKSTITAALVQPKYLKKWYKNDLLSAFWIKSKHIKNRPWFVLYFKGSKFDESPEVAFKDKMVTAMEETIKKWSTGISSDDPYLVQCAIVVSEAVLNSTLPEWMKKLVKWISPQSFRGEKFEITNQDDKLKKFKVYLEDNPGWVIVLDDIQKFAGIAEYLPKKVSECSVLEINPPPPTLTISFLVAFREELSL